MRILLIEDDPLIGDGLEVGLREFGFSVDWFTDGIQGRDAIMLAPYDAAILDLSLPSIDGLDILTHWRREKQTLPVLILTARDALKSKIEGLQLGADDYLCKPFDLAEVVVRIQVLLRRTHGQCTPTINHGDINFSATTRRVTLQGQPVVLTTKETNLLELFLSHPQRVLTKEFIQEKLYSWDEELSSNAVEVHIHNLRHKLGKKLIKTIYGMGYQLGEEQ